MDFIRVLKRIQKKQRMLLQILASDIAVSDENRRLEKIAYGLRTMGLVDDGELLLTSHGKEFISAYGEELFHDISLDNVAVLDKLLQRNARPASTNSKLKKAERLFLTFLSEGPVSIANIRGAKNLIPRLADLGHVVGSETISVTELGLQTLGEEISDDEREKARKRFFTGVRSDGKSRLRERAERFLALYRNGFTYQEIGDLHGLTRERVRQILNMTPNFSAYLVEHEEAERQREIQKQKDARFRQIEKSLANQFPDRVDELWDHEKNAGLDPTKISSRSASVEIWWKCPKDGHSWKKKPSEISVSWWRSGTSGCPRCAGKKKKPVKQRKLYEEYPGFVSRYWDFERNVAEGLDPSEVTLASNWPAWFRCPKDAHRWRAKIHATVKQQWSRGNTGCKVCNGTIDRKVGKWEKAPTLSEKFPDQIRLYWDFELNSDLRLEPSEITIGSSKWAWFRCPVDNNPWRARIAAIRQSWTNGSSGCPACNGRSKGPSFKLTEKFETFVAELWDFAENEGAGLDYDRLTTGSSRVVSFRCPTDGTRWVEPIKEITRYWAAGQNGCPKCTPGRRVRHKTI